MTAPTTDPLALLDSDPAAGILAAADLRERRAQVASPGEWKSSPGMSTVYSPIPGGHQRTAIALYPVDAEHIAAEANPRHSLDEVSLARTLAEVWDRLPAAVRVVAIEAARSYLGGAS